MPLFLRRSIGIPAYVLAHSTSMSRRKPQEPVDFLHDQYFGDLGLANQHFMSGGNNSSMNLPPPAPFYYATPNTPSYHPPTAPPPVYTSAAPPLHQAPHISSSRVSPRLIQACSTLPFPLSSSHPSANHPPRSCSATPTRSASR